MKPDIKKIVSKVKSEKKENLKSEPKPYRERDMRREAVDMGSHRAGEYFGEQDD